MYLVEFYETESGEQPVFDFLMSLDPKMRAKLQQTVRKGII